MIKRSKKQILYLLADNAVAMEKVNLTRAMELWLIRKILKEYLPERVLSVE